MSRSDLDIHLNRIEILAREMNKFIPEETMGATNFRGELAGLLVVSIAASYESCVKDVLVAYASSKHVDFERFTTNQFGKLSSKVTVADLYRYTKLFDTKVHDRFKTILAHKKKTITTKTGHNIEECYEQILKWRHDFAHAGIRNTTIHEALAFHVKAKRVLYAFDRAFSEHH